MVLDVSGCDRYTGVFISLSRTTATGEGIAGTKAGSTPQERERERERKRERSLAFVPNNYCLRTIDKEEMLPVGLMLYFISLFSKC